MSHGSQLDNLKSQFSNLTSDKLSFLDVDMLFFDDSWDFKLRSDMASRGRNELKGGWTRDNHYVSLGLNDSYEVDMFGTDNVFNTVRNIDRKDGACLHLHGLAVLFCSWLKKNLADSFADGKLDQDIIDLFNSKDDFVQFLRVDNLSGITNDVNTDSDTIKVKPKDVELTFTYRLNPKYLVDVLDKFANMSTYTSDWKLSSYKETARKISVLQASKWLRSSFINFLDRRLYDVSDAFLHYRATLQADTDSNNKTFAPGCFMQLRTPKNVDWVAWLIEQTSKYDESQYDVSSFNGDKASEELPLGFEPDIFLTPAVVSEVSTTNFTDEELLEVHITVPGGYSYSSVATAILSAIGPKTYVLNKEENTNKIYTIDGLEGFSKTSHPVENDGLAASGPIHWEYNFPEPSISTVYVDGDRVDFVNSYQDTYITKNGYSCTVSDVKTALPAFLYPRGYSKMLTAFTGNFINKVTLQSARESAKANIILPSDGLYLPREGYLTPLREDDGSEVKDSSYYRPGPAMRDVVVVETLMPLQVEESTKLIPGVLNAAVELGSAKRVSDQDYKKATIYFPSMYIKKPVLINNRATSGILPDSVIKPYAGEITSDFSKNKLEKDNRYPRYWPMCVPVLFLNDDKIDKSASANQPMICTVERDTDRAILQIKKASGDDLSQPFGTPVMAKFSIEGESVGLLATYEGTFNCFSGDVPFTVVEGVDVTGWKYVDIYALQSGINLTVGLGGASQQMFNLLSSKYKNINTEIYTGTGIRPASIPVTALSVANETDTPKLNPLPEIRVANYANGHYVSAGEDLATYPIEAKSHGYYLNRGEKVRVVFGDAFYQYGVMNYLLIGLNGGKPLAAVPLIPTRSYSTSGFASNTSGNFSDAVSYLSPDGVPDWATEDASRGYPALAKGEVGFYRRGKVLDAYKKYLSGTVLSPGVNLPTFYPHSRVFAREVVRV